MWRTSTHLMLCILLFSFMSVGVVFAYNPTSDPSLVAWWQLNEGSGNAAADASTNGNDGTVSGATWLSGRNGNGLYMDGVDDFLDVPAVLSEAGTIAFWFKPDWDGTDPEDYRIFDGSLGAIYFFVSKGSDDANVDPADFGFYLEDATDADYQNVEFGAAGMIFADTWFHIAVTWEFGGGQAVIYFNGEEMARSTALGAFPALNTTPRFGLDIANYLPTTNGAMGVLDEILVFDRALAPDEIPDLMSVAAELASSPLPSDGTTDIPRDNVTLGWTSGEFAATHDVYFGTDFNDVNEASRANPLGLLVSQGQADNTFSPGRLDLGQTYYWRIDEVNAAPDNFIYKGSVWSITIEPVSYALPGANITATSSGSSGNDPNAPNRTIDGSGLNENDQHSTDDPDIWLSSVGVDPTWIQYEFDKPYKLDKMLVWNGNSLVESSIGWGFKDIILETSLDGQSWIVVEGVTQLTQAPGLTSYGPGETILLDSVTARYVRITALSNWGGVLPQYALSEVRFYFVPTYAREPQPASGINAIPPVLAGWRAGREVGEHTLFLDTDANAVVNETAASQTLQNTTIDLGTFGLLLGETYYWKINEVNDAEDPPVWEGPLWNFAIADPLVVDDFEDYSTSDIARRPYVTWRDGLDFSNPPPGGSGNGTGAIVGHDIFSPGSPYFDGDLMELELIHGGAQSLPLYYDNSSTGSSEMTRTITTNQDWTQYGISTLVLHFRGMEGNAGQLYVKINDTKVLYTEDPAAISTAAWTQWNIDLTSIGGDVSSVQRLTIGIENPGSGLVYIDDVRLYRDAPPVLEPVDP